MSELTLRSIEQLLDTRLDLKLEPIKAGMAKLATRDELAVVSAKLDEVKATVDNHTTMLDSIIKNTANWQTEMVVMRGRMERYESALRAIGDKLNLDISPFLH